MLEVIFGFIFGVLSSWLFWRYLLFLKPNFGTPKFIEEITNENGNKEYIYRVRNLGKRQIVDISVRVTICEYTGENSEYPLRLVHRLKVDLDEADVLYPVEKSSCSDHWKPASYRGFHIQ